ncbi:MutS-related protein, family 1 [Fulvivirga imtechensis AK7]|uniref:MutS-related protein, family 1 n=1 Tax=Fulvivirga imtechensis AK7 TaxID=1237149 RepID=L8JR44_9BACT|nr:MutS-related protein, family 1 [Fulvivirga imtechensis]ELR70673.1 MutS-related protein, family 1 [Fulvivirga imtechensis AK7]
MNLTPEAIFKQRKERFDQSYNSLNQKYNGIAATRIAIFVISIVLVVLFANYRLGYAIGITAVAFPVIFGLVVRHHNRITAKRDVALASALINDQEIQRLTGNFNGLSEGEEFRDKKHPYLSDLDVFGKNSLYQLVNRSVTPSGRATVAHWLQQPATTQETRARQEAVNELRPQVDWRQEFQASGMQKSDDHHVELLLSWINEPNRVLDKKIYQVAAVVLPVVSIALLLLNIFAGISFYFFVGMLAINGLVLKKFADYVENITEKTFTGIKTLQSYGRMIKKIEMADFSCTKLRTLQSVFAHDNVSASDSILKLQRILDYLQARSNLFYLFFNFALLFDLQLVIRAEKWKARQKGDVSLWFDHIGQLEAINSLSGLAFANPEYCIPEICDDPYYFQATDLGHPLIHISERVVNDFTMEGKGTINIITGSNMSGKSTFLRTIGVNTILASTGGPVCAGSMKVSRMQVFTSMRTEDNLEEHVSSFYAELRRIRMLLDMLEEKKLPVLFMLDEILKGTNSKDRHAGAAALIRQVSSTESMGFVSTHDLELGQLANELLNVKNYSFNSEVKDDQIIFNYQLEEGICHSFNASKLMENIGINMKR